MARRIIWTESAWQDLEEIAVYIERDSKHYASAFVREVRNAALSLTVLSERGRPVPEVNLPTVREIFVRSYRLIYQITRTEIYIVALVHGARDLKNKGVL